MLGEVSTVCEVPSPLAVTITRSPALILVSSRQNKIFKVTQEGMESNGEEGREGKRGGGKGGEGRGNLVL